MYMCGITVQSILDLKFISSHMGRYFIYLDIETVMSEFYIFKNFEND